MRIGSDVHQPSHRVRIGCYLPLIAFFLPMATAGGVVFFGDPNGAFVAVDERNGKTLWHFNTNVGMKASPMAFAVDGKQFVAVAPGPVFLCFGLPSP